MPSVSKSQSRFMNGCKHNPQHMKGKCPDEKTVNHFAGKPRKGLPEKKARKKRPPYFGGK